MSPPLTGSRWLTRYDKEVELLVKITYQALTTGRGTFLHLCACYCKLTI